MSQLETKSSVCCKRSFSMRLTENYFKAPSLAHPWGSRRVKLLKVLHEFILALFAWNLEEKTEETCTKERAETQIFSSVCLQCNSLSLFAQLGNVLGTSILDKSIYLSHQTSGQTGETNMRVISVRNKDPWGRVCWYWGR